MENKDKFLENFDKVILLTVSIICGIVIFFGLMGRTTIFGWSIDYAYISCVLLCAIATHFILSIYGSFGHKQIENKINQSVTSIVESLNGVEKITFNTIKEVDSYVANRIKNAKNTVQDLNWQDFRIPVTNHTQQHRQEVDDEIDDSIKEFCNRKRNLETKKKSVYEEIFTFPKSNKRNLQKMKSHVNYGDIYSCYYYETLEELKFPKLQFVIIDDEEVIFVSSEYKENFCAIKDRRIVNICLNYFMQARELSIMIKQRNHTADQNLIKQIEDKYK